MQYDLTHQLTDESGDPAKDETGADAPLVKILSRALLTDTADNTASKLERFELWLKLKGSALKVDLSTEEAALIKKAASIYPTLIHGQLVHWIEGKI